MNGFKVASYNRRRHLAAIYQRIRMCAENNVTYFAYNVLTANRGNPIAISSPFEKFFYGFH